MLTPRRSTASSWKGRSGVAMAACREQFVVGQLVEQRLAGVAVQAEATLFERAQALLQRFRERAADRHRLADRLHLRTEHPGGAGELLEGPTRHLGHDVVDGRLEAGRRLPGDVVRDLVERVADCELGGDLRDRKPGRLRRQRRRTAHARVHLDDDHVAVGRVERELHVRPAGLDADPADARERGVAHALGTRRRSTSAPAPP